MATFDPFLRHLERSGDLIALPVEAEPLPQAQHGAIWDRRVLPALALIVSGDRHAEDDAVTANAWARGVARRFSGLSLRYRVVVLLHGAAPGIDTIAHVIGSEYSFSPVPLPFIEGIGRAGGAKRNEAILKAAAAFHETGYDRLALLLHPNLNEGGSRGTLNMRRLIDRDGRIPYEVYASPEDMNVDPEDHPRLRDGG